MVIGDGIVIELKVGEGEEQYVSHVEQSKT